jgi:hypothetical protein
MYSVDHKDTVVDDTDAPQCDGGAPCPVVLSNDRRTALAYYVYDTQRIPHEQRQKIGYPVAILYFKRTHAVLFGGPNDEAIAGHPLASRGLHPYGPYWVENSSWLRRCIEMNRVHPSHSDSLFAGYRHFVFAFHDSLFECLSHGYEVEMIQGKIGDALPKMQPHASCLH